MTYRRIYELKESISLYNELHILSQIGKCFIDFKKWIKEETDEKINLTFHDCFLIVNRDIANKLKRFDYKYYGMILIDNSLKDAVAIQYSFHSERSTINDIYETTVKRNDKII